MTTAAPEIPESLAKLYVTHRVLTMESAAVPISSEQNINHLRQFFLNTKGWIQNTFKRWDTAVYPKVSFTSEGRFQYKDVLGQRAYVPAGLLVTMPEYVTSLEAGVTKIFPSILSDIRACSAVIGKAINDADLRRSHGFVKSLTATDINDDLADLKKQFGKGNVTQTTIGKAYLHDGDFKSVVQVLISARNVATKVHPQEVRKEVDRFVVLADTLTEELIKDYGTKDISSKMVNDISTAIYGVAKLIEYYGYLVNATAEAIVSWNDTDAQLKKNN